MATEDSAAPAAEPASNSRVFIKTGTVTLSIPKRALQDAGVVLTFGWFDDGLEVSGDVSRGASGLMISRVEVTSPAPKGITHQLLRKAPLGDILATARAYLARQETVLSVVTEAPSPSKRAQHTPMTDDLLRRVAMAYLEETGPGKDRAAITRMEQRFDRPRGTILTWVNRARKEGWLGPAVRGRMGSEPGPKLANWIVDVAIQAIKSQS